MRIYLKADYHKRFKKKKRWLRIHEIKDKKRRGGQREDIDNPINTEQSQIQN